MDFDTIATIVLDVVIKIILPLLVSFGVPMFAVITLCDISKTSISRGILSIILVFLFFVVIRALVFGVAYYPFFSGYMEEGVNYSFEILFPSPNESVFEYYYRFRLDDPNYLSFLTEYGMDWLRVILVPVFSAIVFVERLFPVVHLGIPGFWNLVFAIILIIVFTIVFPIVFGSKKDIDESDRIEKERVRKENESKEKVGHYETTYYASGNYDGSVSVSSNTKYVDDTKYESFFSARFWGFVCIAISIFACPITGIFVMIVGIVKNIK